MTINKEITIFLVDDNALYLKNLEIAFSSKSYYKVYTFATGELCLSQMALNPDIIILDYYLNSIKKDARNGLELLKNIRGINSEVPVVFLSAETNPTVTQNCLDNNASEFIVKDDISFSILREISTNILLDNKDENKGNLISYFNNAFMSAALFVLTIIVSICEF